MIEAADAAVSSVDTGAFKISPSSFPRHCLHISAHKNTSDLSFYSWWAESVHLKSDKTFTAEPNSPNKKPSRLFRRFNPWKDFVTK